ncbi:MAG: hypothetical protein AB7U73_01920 [Pirellulales bacterium]
MTAVIERDTVFVGTSPVFLGRIKGDAGEYLTQVDVASISCQVFNAATGVQVANPSIAVGDVIFDTLQTGGPWTKDAVGYNFRHTMPTSVFATAGLVYRVEYLLTQASGVLIPAFFQVTGEAKYSA